MWFDTASSRIDPVAESAIHRIWRAVVGGGSSRSGAALANGAAADVAAAKRRLAHPVAAQSTVKAA
ncbi:MAG: hypothetical protein DYH14_16395 [Betaproteobacteria bacterium PRO3]|nr:hypothetical protein [Betaproteobacteria bacterium PRO3]